MEFKNFASSTKKAPFTSPYPPIALSSKEKKQLRQLTKTLVEVNVDGYEEFLYEHKGKLPESEWKFFRRDEQVETFLRRRETYNLRGFEPPRSSVADRIPTARPAPAACAVKNCRLLMWPPSDPSVRGTALSKTPSTAPWAPCTFKTASRTAMSL